MTIALRITYGIWIVWLLVELLVGLLFTARIKRLIQYSLGALGVNFAGFLATVLLIPNYFGGSFFTQLPVIGLLTLVSVCISVIPVWLWKAWKVSASKIIASNNISGSRYACIQALLPLILFHFINIAIIPIDGIMAVRAFGAMDFCLIAIVWSGLAFGLYCGKHTVSIPAFCFGILTLSAIDALLIICFNVSIHQIRSYVLNVVADPFHLFVCFVIPEIAVAVAGYLFGKRFRASKA